MGFALSNCTLVIHPSILQCTVRGTRWEHLPHSSYCSSISLQFSRAYTMPERMCAYKDKRIVALTTFTTGWIDGYRGWGDGASATYEDMGPMCTETNLTDMGRNIYVERIDALGWLSSCGWLSLTESFRQGKKLTFFSINNNFFLLHRHFITQ